jgi:hypothetical protein
MRFNRSFFCWLSATYGLIVYSIAFGIEMWFIVANDEQINNSVAILALILSAIYLIVSLMSLVLMMALIIHSIICISFWLLVMCFTFLPECGLVLFITIHKWVSIVLFVRNGNSFK